MANAPPSWLTEDARAALGEPGVVALTEAWHAALARFPRLVDADTLADVPWQPGMHVTEVLLAHASAAGDDAALLVIDGLVRDQVPLFVAHLRLSSDDLAEVQQRLRMKLFTAAPGRQAGILQYAGRAELGGWLRVVAIREGLQLKRSQPSAQVTAAGIDTHPGVLDPALAALKATYRGEFRVAFAEAVDGLAPEQRTLLRFAVIDQLTLDQIGQAANVHAATVSRRLAQIRELLARRTAVRLGARLGLDAAEVASALRLIESQLDASVSRVLS